MDSAVVGRKAVSSSAVDKLKKKRRKKRKTKEGKRSSASSASATGSPEFDGAQVRKTRSTYSCPPDIKQTPLVAVKLAQESDEVLYNESLRWLPLIVAHSAALPPTSSSSLYSAATADRLSANPLEESGEEKEERLAIYKMNRRKRYLAAQQSLLDLYPDNNVYAGASLEKEGRLPTSTSIYYSSSSSTPQESSIGGYNNFQMAMPPLNREASLPQEVV